MDKIQVKMGWVKETKNKHRYEASDGDAVDCVYLEKRVTGPTPPKVIQVTVEAVA